MFYFSDIEPDIRRLLNDPGASPRFTKEVLRDYSFRGVRDIHMKRADSRIGSDSSLRVDGVPYTYTASSYMTGYGNILGWNRDTYPTLFAMMYVDSTGSISAFADAGDSIHVVVTDTAHGLDNGMTVIITGTTNYNGTFAISSVTANTYEIVDTWVADDATGTWVNNTVRFYTTSADRLGDTDEVAEITRVYTPGVKPVRALNSSGWGGTAEILTTADSATTWDVWATEASYELSDYFREPLIDYVLSRCFSADSEDTADSNLEQKFYNKYIQGLGL